MTQGPHPHRVNSGPTCGAGAGSRTKTGRNTLHSGPLVLGGEGVGRPRGLAQIFGGCGGKGRSESTAVRTPLPLCPRTPTPSQRQCRCPGLNPDSLTLLLWSMLYRYQFLCLVHNSLPASVCIVSKCYPCSKSRVPSGGLGGL